MTYFVVNGVPIMHMLGDPQTSGLHQPVVVTETRSTSGEEKQPSTGVPTIGPELQARLSSTNQTTFRGQRLGIVSTVVV